MRVRDVAICVVAMLAFSACNGDDDAVSTTTEAVAETTSTTSDDVDATTAPTTTVLTTTTDSTTTSSLPPPTSTDSTAPSTTSDPTVDETVQAVLDVIEAIERADRASSIAQRDPTNDALLEGLAEVYTGTLLEGFQNVINSYRDENLRTIENLEVPDGIEVALASVAVNESLTAGTAQACDITSDVLVEVGGNADGSDRIVDDRIGRTVLEIELVRVDGVWLVADVVEPSESDRIASCD